MIKSLSKNIIDVKTFGLAVKTVKSYGQTVWERVEPTPVEFGGLKFTALEAGTISLVNRGTNTTTTKPNLSYSKNGSTWTEWDYSPISVTTGDKVYFKGVNDSIGHLPNSDGTDNSSTFNETNRCNISGNIMSLLYGDDYEGKTNLTGKDYVFEYLFCKLSGELNESNIVDASGLILPSLDVPRYGYYHLFYNTSTLIEAPELPALSVGERGYASLFQGTSLTNYTYDLPAQTLSDNSYRSMFNSCNSLVSCGNILATEMSTYNCSYMFKGCTSLTTAPELNANKLSSSCYDNMFNGCSSLTSSPYLPATKLVGKCYRQMFYGCSNLNYVKANFTTKPSSSYTSNWLSGVASTGTFVANPEATWTDTVTRGTSTVPENWTIQK